MDDLLLIKPTAESLQDLKDKLTKRFDMTDMSLAEDYLGIKVSQQQGKTTLSQSAFIIKILKHFSIKKSKPVSTFMKYEA